MTRRPFPTEPQKTEDARFQLSLLRLLYHQTASCPQLTELEGLLKPPAKFAPAQ
jgi:hypothetical protein